MNALNGVQNGVHHENGVKNGLNGLNGHQQNGHSETNNGSHEDSLKHHYNVNAITNKDFSFEKVKEIADWLLERVELRPKIGIVCGSGLGGLGDRLTNTKVFPYGDVPNFPKSTGKPR
jgi:hypothetical protein